MLGYAYQNNLCTRCGTCAAVCPVNAINFGGINYPISNSSCTSCGLCTKACPGIEVNIPGITTQLFDRDFKSKEVLGFFQEAYVGYAMDEKIRKNASSGGVITQLLIYLLEKKTIDGAIVTVMDKTIPWKSKVIVAKTKYDLMQSMQSRYTVVPVNKILNEIKEMPGKFAFVGLPCQVHGLRKLANIDSIYRTKIYLVLGLFCQLNIEQEGIIQLQKISGYSNKNIKKFEYRGGDWPGEFRVTMEDDSIHNLHYSNFKDGAYNYLSRLYYVKRCLYCIDGSSELADISFADPWIQNRRGDWLFKGGWTLIFNRTEIGGKVLCESNKDNAIFLKELSENYHLFDRFTRNIGNKRIMSLIRIQKLKNKNRPAPEYYLDTSSITEKDRRKEYLFSLTLLVADFNRIRQLVMRIIFSDIGIIITKLRIILKYKIFNKNRKWEE